MEHCGLFAVKEHLFIPDVICALSSKLDSWLTKDVILQPLPLCNFLCLGLPFFGLKLSFSKLYFFPASISALNYFTYWMNSVDNALAQTTFTRCINVSSFMDF